jgi:hypothetical protein
VYRPRLFVTLTSNCVLSCWCGFISFYYSFTYDLTHSLQYNMTVASPAARYFRPSPPPPASPAAAPAPSSADNKAEEQKSASSNGADPFGFGSDQSAANNGGDALAYNEMFLWNLHLARPFLAKLPQGKEHMQIEASEHECCERSCHSIIYCDAVLVRGDRLVLVGASDPRLLPSAHSASRQQNAGHFTHCPPLTTLRRHSVRSTHFPPSACVCCVDRSHSNSYPSALHTATSNVVCPPTRLSHTSPTKWKPNCS